jgi:hypothetical protein
MRHAGPIHQDRDDPDVARQGGLDLQAHEVIGVIETTLPMCIGDRQPLLTDQRQQHVAGPDRSGDHLHEVIAQLDGVHVLEDLVAAEAVGQSVVQPAGRVGRLLPPITHEDPTRRGRNGISHCPRLLRLQRSSPPRIIDGASDARYLVLSRPDSFPAASPVPAQRQQHETDKPDSGPKLLIRIEADLAA